MKHSHDKCEIKNFMNVKTFKLGCLKCIFEGNIDNLIDV
jgi:hypothetical protein